MSVSDALQKYRGMDKGRDESSSGVRQIRLSEEEMKPLEQVPDGQEVKCNVTARKEGDHLHVLSVAYTGGGDESTMPDQNMNEMAAKVAGVQAPMMRSQVAPSPS